jgi:hypothetical protein
MKSDSVNRFSWFFVLKNMAIVYIVLFFAAPTLLTTLLSSSDVDCDLIEWQSEDDSAEEDCLDDFMHLYNYDLFSGNMTGTEKLFLNDIFNIYSDYDPDILIPPPRSI